MMRWTIVMPFSRFGGTWFMSNVPPYAVVN